jgi:hypothetical protein
METRLYLRTGTDADIDRTPRAWYVASPHPEEARGEGAILRMLTFQKTGADVLDLDAPGAADRVLATFEFRDPSGYPIRNMRVQRLINLYFKLDGKARSRPEQRQVIEHKKILRDVFRPYLGIDVVRHLEDADLVSDSAAESLYLREALMMLPLVDFVETIVAVARKCLSGSEFGRSIQAEDIVSLLQDR